MLIVDLVALFLYILDLVMRMSIQTMGINPLGDGLCGLEVPVGALVR